VGDLLGGDPDVGGAEHFGLVDGAVGLAPFEEFEPRPACWDVVDAADVWEICDVSHASMISFGSRRSPKEKGSRGHQDLLHGPGRGRIPTGNLLRSRYRLTATRARPMTTSSEKGKAIPRRPDGRCIGESLLQCKSTRGSECSVGKQSSKQTEVECIRSTNN